MHLVGFIIRIYHDARSSKRQIQVHCWVDKLLHSELARLSSYEGRNAIHTLLAGFFLVSTLYDWSRQSVSYICRCAAICFCYVGLHSRRSTVSSASAYSSRWRHSQLRNPFLRLHHILQKDVSAPETLSQPWHPGSDWVTHLLTHSHKCV